MDNKFYITTAIAYASSKPHIGNSYDIVLADAIARYKRQKGFDVYFLTGSDEHGQKIEGLAKAAGINEQTYVDEKAATIKAVWDSLDVTYDKFIRTTDGYHKSAVKRIFKKLYEQGDIYKGHYEGKYCVPCESFFTASQLVDGKCPDCNREVKDAKEEAYFLKLSKYADRLVEYYEQNPSFFTPESRKAEMINNFIKPGLQDLCVSRTSFKWGIPVDFDDKHVIYVWIDALSNYITALGYTPDEKGELYNKYWPADLHVIGKDIVRFHTIYWPVILMALGEPLPKQVLGHPWMLSGDDKMSKSKGNVIYSDYLAGKFSADAVRYYLLSEMPFAQDGVVTYESFINKYNTDLANTLGNLVNRTIAMTNKYFGGTVAKPTKKFDFDADLISVCESTIEKFNSLMEIYHNADAVDCVMNLARRCNKYIDETMPWALAKDENEKEHLAAVMYNLLESIRVLAALLTPIIPGSAEKIRGFLANSSLTESFGETESFTVSEATPLFARIDAPKMLKEIEEETKPKEEPKKEEENIALIGIEDFAKVSLIAAKVTACEPIPKAKKLLKLTLNDGSGKDRTVASGIANYYTPEELVGKTVVVVSNLKPAKLCGVESNGMILAADAGDDVKVIFLDGVEPGSKIR